MKVRDPLFLEDWPLLYALWSTARNFRGAFVAHYLRKGPSYGPSPWFWLRWRVLKNALHCGQVRMHGRIKALTINS